ncbi:LytR/AlgR family response regulator transcription factor [Yeosuana sp. AK3]
MYVIFQVLLFSFIISVFHQICSNLIFYVALYFKDSSVLVQSLITVFWELILTGMFIRVIESIVITLFLYVISNNEKKIRSFIASHWPKFYDFIIDKKGLIQIIKIKEKGTIVSLNVDDIVWFSSSGNYIKIHHLRKTYLLRQTMASLLSQLDSQMFLRVHRSSIINIDFIEQINYMKNGEYKIILKDNSEITSSRNFKEGIRNKLKLEDISK